MRAALILRAPLLIRLRFAADPSGWRPRYHPLRFARIIRCAPRCAARDARTASRMPVPARRLEIADKRFNPRLPGGRRPLRSRPYRRDRPGRQRDDQSAGEPARSPHRARAGPLARMVARAPQDVHAHRHDPRQRFAPDAAQNAPGASQKPVPRARRSAGACRGARTDRRTSPRQRYAPALRARRRPERARSQPQAPTARYFASARSPTRSGFDCDARALRNCNSTRPSCARRRRRSASVIGCGRPAWSHRMHSSFVRVGFSFLLHVHAGRYGCSASGFHSLTSSRSRNRSSSVRE